MLNLVSTLVRTQIQNDIRRKESNIVKHIKENPKVSFFLLLCQQAEEVVI